MSAPGEYCAPSQIEDAVPPCLRDMQFYTLKFNFLYERYSNLGESQNLASDEFYSVRGDR